MPECEINQNCKENFVQIQADLRKLQRESDENKNGNLIREVQTMFNNAAQITATENARRDAEKLRADEKQEKAAEKQNALIVEISKDVNKFNTKMDTLETKVNKIEIDQTALTVQVNNREESTKIDTSLFLKWVIGVAGVLIVGAIVSLVLRAFNII